MRKLVEVRIANDEDLVKAIKELAWQGNNALLRGTETILEIWGDEERPLMPKGQAHQPAYR